MVVRDGRSQSDRDHDPNAGISPVQDALTLSGQAGRDRRVELCARSSAWQMTLRSRNLHRPSPDVRPTEPRPTPRRQRSPAAGRSCAALVLVCLGFSLLLGHHVLDRKGGNRPVTGPRSESVNSLGFAWGSLIAPYHPNGPVPRGLPVQIMPRRARSLHRPVEVCIVTTELAGLHKTGGIGTAFLELAKLLAPLKDFAVTVVVTHARREFAPSAVAVQERL